MACYLRKTGAKGVRDEWHLLKPFWMSKLSYFFARLGTWLSEQWQRFRSSFDGPRLDATRPSADAALCNQGQQAFDVHFVGWQPALAPRQP